MDEDKTIEKYDETMDIIDEEEEESPIIMEVENSDSNIEENLIEYIVEKLDDDKNDSSLEEATSANNSLSETNVKELKEVVTPGTSTSSNQLKVGAKTPAGGGQIVILQGSGGQHQQVRIAQNHAPQGHGFKFLKTTDGNIIQIRNKSSPNSVPLNTMKKIVPQPMIKNTIGKLIYKGISVSGNEQQILLATPPTKTTASNSSGTIMTPIPTPKTISLSQAQQLGLLAGKMKQIVTIGQKPKTLQLIKPAPKILPATSTGTTNSNVYTNVVKKFGLPQLQPKIAIQQINKTDVKKVQYVRFVSIGGSTATTPTTSTVTAGKLSTQGKVMASLPAGQQKILIQGKSGQTVAVIQKPPNSSGQTKIMTMTPMQSKQVATNKGVLQTYATQKKIFSLGKQPNENLPKLIAVVKKEDGQKSNMEMGGQKITTLTQLQLSQLQGTSVIPGNHKNPPIVMLPSNFIQQLQLKNNNNLKRKEEEMSPPPAKIKKESDLSDEDIKLSPSSDGIRRKPCNCTKSLCLKLYCDCFANGEFCQNCNCKKCYNNLENEEERQKAIRICLERNPNAFRPKIGKAKDHNESFRRHNKGCNCKRSGCLKNYCECYEAKISCSGNCKCIDCRNTDDYVEREGNNEESDTPRSSKRSLEVDNANPKQPYNFMTPDVIDATIQCMIAQADECQRTGIPTKNAEKMILEEFGRCLVEIIDFSIRNTDND